MDYIGTELELFEQATRWKRYWSAKLRPHVRGRVLEVGAGVGGNIPFLVTTSDSYSALEPDPTLTGTITQKIADGGIPKDVNAITGFLSDLPEDARFDTIIYIDVLEHIEDDKAEFERACTRLAPGGKLLVLCPAHQFLFSPFDAAIGHFRRHNRRSFKALGVNIPHITLSKLFYLDSVGFFASLANKWILKSDMPSPGQIAMWDKVMVPLSHIADPLTFFRAGKTIIGIWERD